MRFRERVLAGYPGAKPEILVTGRTAFVGELSREDADRCDRHAFRLRRAGLAAFSGSASAACGRCWRSCTCCCSAAWWRSASGALLFHELNMITIGLCSILIGLGVDFGMMLYAIYEVARDAGQSFEEAVATRCAAQGRSVIFGALTSAAGFSLPHAQRLPGVHSARRADCLRHSVRRLLHDDDLLREHQPRASAAAAPIRCACWATASCAGFLCAIAPVWMVSGAVLLGLTRLMLSCPSADSASMRIPRRSSRRAARPGGRCGSSRKRCRALAQQLLVLLEKQNAQETHDGWARAAGRAGRVSWRIRS